ncbi:MAG: hypothetical protein JST28_20080 [Acidobacteria bacterium]|nr:hypothetical protein [Acidobacteriota bacterium]
MPQCQQSQRNGQRCTSPAIPNSIFCRQHDQMRQVEEAQEKETQNMRAMTFPRLVDRRSALDAINFVLAALADDHIKRTVADTFLNGIRMASRTMREMEEAGEAVTPSINYRQPKPVALAAPIVRPRAAEPFNPARIHREPVAPNPSPIDPATSVMIKELVAQSHEMAARQAAKI